MEQTRGWRALHREYLPTSNGSQLDHNAHERMIKRKPTARTKDSRMMANDRGRRAKKVSQYRTRRHSSVYSLFSPAAMMRGAGVGGQGW